MVNVPARISVVLPSHPKRKHPLKFQLEVGDRATQQSQYGTGFVIVFECVDEARAHETNQLVCWIYRFAVALVLQPSPLVLWIRLPLDEVLRIFLFVLGLQLPLGFVLRSPQFIPGFCIVLGGILRTPAPEFWI